MRKRSKGYTPPLKFREYERINPYRHDEDDEEYEDPDADDWEEFWDDEFPELNDLDGIDDFLDDIEYDDSDKYREPS